MKTLLLFCSILIIQDITAFTVCSGETVGVSSPGSFTSDIDSSGVGYLLEDETYQVMCCGYISAWQYGASGPGRVMLQIWRKIGTKAYTLIGKNNATIVTAGVHALSSIAQEDRIYVQHGDYIGWYSTTNVIQHSTGRGNPITNWYSTAITDVDVGSIHDWTSENSVGTEMKFAIKATVTASTVPVFLVGLSVNVTIDDTTAAEETILTLSVSGDGGDTVAYSTSANDNSYFYVDTSNGHIKTSQTHIPEGTYTITPMVTDVCYNTAKTVVTITVSNVDIIFGGFSEVSATISEDDYLERNLTYIIVTEPSDGYYCYFTSDSTFPFVTRQSTSLYPDYAIYLQDWPQLDYDTTASYVLTVECIEATSSAPVSVAESFTVNIVRNTGPSMTTSTDSTSLDSTTDWTGKLVYTVSATDPENDPLSMTLSMSPTGGPFCITDAGKILLTSNIKDHTTTNSYVLSVTVTDSDVNSQKQMTVIVTINNINNKPVINNLPANPSVKENEALGKSVFQVSVTDGDRDTIELYAEFNPSYGGKVFTLNSSTGEIFTCIIDAIDYDVISNHDIQIYMIASDGKYLDTKTLTITIGNENEPPVMSQTYYRIARDEGMSGDIFPTIPYEVEDPDVAYAGDTFSFSKDCGADDSRVSMTASTGQFSFNSDYDLDNSSNPTEFTCIVTVTDSAGLTDTCTVDVHVDYVNEFTPNFTSMSYTATVLYTELIGTIVITATATDNDQGSHGTFFYELSNHEDLFGVFQNGSIFLNGDLLPYYPDGQNVVMTLKAEDTGGLSSTVPVTITIPPTTVVTVEYTTETPWTFFDDQINMITYELAGVVGLACLIVAVYLALKYIRFTTGELPKTNSVLVNPVTLPQVYQPDSNHGPTEEQVSNDENVPNQPSHLSNSSTPATQSQ